MPIGKGVRYAMKKTKKGMVRLAFKDGEVVEAKNMKSGATHTSSEFMKDKQKNISERIMKATTKKKK